MEDEHIVALYWARSEDAIKETASKYGNYCYSIAYRILADSGDAEKSVNDAYLGAWNSPPYRPKVLSAFLGKITRRIALKKRQKNYAAKRGGSKMMLVLEELEDCIPADRSIEQEIMNMQAVTSPETAATARFTLIIRRLKLQGTEAA